MTRNTRNQLQYLFWDSSSYTMSYFFAWMAADLYNPLPRFRHMMLISAVELNDE